ncbi:MAG: hypothetical protein HQ548_04785 [Chloroflexi bacterium]|nr:hypothetical protein [Chloroflexota bacterium]
MVRKRRRVAGQALRQTWGRIVQYRSRANRPLTPSKRIVPTIAAVT